MKGFARDFDKHMEALDYFDTWRKSTDKFNEQAEVKPMNEEESNVWSKYIGQGTLARSRMSKGEIKILDSLISDKLMRLETKPQKKIKTRHQVRAHADSIDYKKSKDVKELQNSLNEYLGPKGVNAYDRKDSLRVDGAYGPKTQFRLQRFRDLDEHITQDSVFNALQNQREQWEIDRSKNWKRQQD